MNVPTPVECVNADALQPAESVTPDAPPVSGDDDRRHRRRIEMITAAVSLIVALATLITALKS
ncbi:hypothetical protein [Micromonospora cremea]|uniref:Uncharacterized protein n=1 Tax=Micromonospora cremea TaxID=709881 RepID=A0A1N6AVX0_9ACTN|nr:hypothetical protein [Micromonospora cremea]SIN38083.1 hypothetical protein SAMN04489832_6238 [Micromonospora cremea]